MNNSKTKSKLTSKDRDVQFMFEIGCLRFVKRQWVQFLSPNFANLSEHTLRVTWIALLIASKEGIKNTGKIAKMALVHDLSESRNVDVHYLSRQYVKRNEEQSIKDSLADTSLEKEMMALYEEYEKRESIEAKIVKDADNLDVDLELMEQAAMGNKSLNQSWRKMRNHVGTTKLYTKTAKQFYQKIIKANPHDWHLQANNRFMTGDWSDQEES